MNRKTKKASSHFKTMKLQNKIKEVMKLSKRANVRLKLQEKTGLTGNSAYENSQYYNEQKGRKSNRFYQGKKYKNEKEVNQAFSYLKNYLDKESSTLTLIKKDITTKIKKDDVSGIDVNKIPKKSEKELQYISQGLSKKANSRLRSLEKKGITQYAYSLVQHYNIDEQGKKKNRFASGKKIKNKYDLRYHVLNMLSFLKAKTSTVKGYKKAVGKTIQAFREKGINIKKGKEKAFFNFLNSDRFDGLKKYNDSDQLAETYNDAINSDIEISQINKEFEKFQKSDDMTIDEVQERLNEIKKQGKKLLH